MTQTAPPRPACAGPIVIRHAGGDAAWAQWLQEIAHDAGLGADTLRVERGSAPLLDGLPESVGSVLFLVSRTFLLTADMSGAQWEAQLAEAEARSITTTAVIVGAARVPDEARALPAVDLRAVDAQEARIRVLRALGAAPDRAAARTASLDLAARVPVRFPGLAPRYQSPSVPEHQPEWFYGRERELDEVRTWLDDTGAVALCGMPSGGKTWLAAEYLHRFKSQYDLVAWVRAGQSAMLREDLGRLAAPLGISADQASNRHEAVVEALRNTNERYLIVYDDAVPDDHPRRQEEAFTPRQKQALLSELVPWGGHGHVLFTSVSERWDSSHPIRVEPFTAAEGTAFLVQHVSGLPDENAGQFSAVADGNPLTLSVVAHVLSEGTLSTAELLELVEADVVRVLEEFPIAGYRRPHSVFAGIMGVLLSGSGSDGRMAAELVRLLTCFAPEPLPLALITSQMSGTEREPCGRLPEELATALRTVQRRKAILDHIAQTGLAVLGTDHVTGTGRVLALHRLTWNGVRDQLPARIAERNRHIAHRILCDADPLRPARPELWPRYLQLWRQLPPSEALACERVAEPGDACAQLPVLVGNIIRALRDKGEVTAAADLGAQAAEAWGPSLGAGHVGLALIRIETSSTLVQLGRSAEALAAALAARGGVEEDRSRHPVEFVRASSLVAAGTRQTGDWVAAAPYDEEAYGWAKEFIGNNDVATIRAAHNLSVSYRMLGRFKEALDLDSDTYARCQENPALGEHDPLTLHSVNNIARDRRELGDYESAARMQEHVVARFEGLLHDPRHQHVLRAQKNLAVSYRKSGRYQRALDVESQALADHTAVYGPNNLETIAAETNLANDCRLTGNLDEALRHAAAAYDRCRALNPTHPYTAACAVNYAAALRARNQHDEALRLDRQAVATFTSRLGAQHPYTLAAQVDVASDLAGQGRTAEAAALGGETLELSRSVRGPDHPYTLQCAVNLCIDLRALGDRAKADALERDTLERYAETLGREHPECRAAVARTRGTCDVEPPPM